MRGSPASTTNPALINRLGTVHGVAVDEPYRGQGIAQALIAEAERSLARQRYGLITMNHKPDLTSATASNASDAWSDYPADGTSARPPGASERCRRRSRISSMP
ncbi:GNAT family N-acetyltransferase [Streptomyces sp. NPDC049099]|uniref:GNAT family N-acetyltransferase n=1 Tax=Streptomyces sp. NPDC049099 TaxID=3155768 RepID=UPI003423C517